VIGKTPSVVVPPGFTTERAFTDNSSNATKSYLIFRVKAADIPVDPVK
jgi:hypothetical protein